MLLSFSFKVVKDSSFEREEKEKEEEEEEKEKEEEDREDEFLTPIAVSWEFSPSLCTQRYVNWP